MSALAARLPAPPRGPAHAALQEAGRALGRLLVWLAAAFVLWEGAVVVFGIRPFYLPRLTVIAAAFAQAPQAYVAGFFHTLAETLIGFLAGAAFGIGAGIAFFRFRLLREMVFPLFIVSQTIPVIAFGALVVLWFGNTLMAKAVISFYLTFFPVTVNTLLGLRSVDPRQEQLMQSFGATRRQLLAKLQFPTALPQIFVALRLAASLSLVGAIVGEWFGDTTGIGVLLLQAMFTENVPAIWAALLTAALLGTSLYACVALAERVVVFWSAEP